MIYNFNRKTDILIKINKILQDKSPLIISGGSTIKQILKNYNNRISNKKILISDERLIKSTSKLRNDFFFKKLIQKKIMK